MFAEPEYLLMLYKALHPEDVAVTEKDLRTVTLHSVIVNQVYNDLGFTVRGRLMILLEAQSTWSLNIIIRILIYLAEEWKNHIHETGQNPYVRRKLVLPKPEFYVIYTGHDKNNVKEEYSLADEFFGGDRSFIDVNVRVITDGRKGDIINQYVTFTKILDDQVRKYGRTKKAVKRTIRICKDQNVLREYLESRKKEVMGIMDILYDQKWLNKTYKAYLKEEGREEGVKLGTKKGIRLGSDSTAEKVYNNCLDRGMSEADAIAISEIPADVLPKARERRNKKK